MYVPQSPPSDLPDVLQTYLSEELNRISSTLQIALARNVEFLSVAPKRPREGLVAGADGVNWNPGSGKGVYAYYTSAWHYLG